MTNRTGPTQLPTNQEISDILQIEGKRKPRKKEHFVDFTSVNNWLKACDIVTDFFDKEYLSIDLMSDAEVSRIKNETIEATLRKQLEPNFQNIVQQVTKYLGEEDSLEKADIIFVYGSPFLYRIEKAVELYNQGLAPKILCTGKGPHYKNDKLPAEAELSAKRALELGVPQEAIIIEPESITIADNVKRGLNKLEELNIPHKKIIQIMAWYAQRRAWASMQKLSDPDTHIIRINSAVFTPEVQENTWFTNQKGIELVFNEFIKLKISRILETA